MNNPPVFEEANAQNRTVPRVQVVELKSSYCEKERKTECVRGGFVSYSLFKKKEPIGG